MALRRSLSQTASVLHYSRHRIACSTQQHTHLQRLHSTEAASSQSSGAQSSEPTDSVSGGGGEKEVIYVNPSHAMDGYEIVNSRYKPTLPALGLGTWGCDHFTTEQIARSVDMALRIGYRHIDCARVHNNQQEIGAVIKDHIDSGSVRREDLFITSKLYNNEHAPPDGATVRALEDTLKDMQLDYLDAFLIQWPFRNSIHHPPLPFVDDEWFFTYKLIHEMCVQGLTASVGVGNATITKLKQLLIRCQVLKVKKPGILQNELHPYLQWNALLQYCEDNDIVVTAAMPLMSPERPQRCRRDDDPDLFEDAVLKQIANETGKSVAQCVIRWHLQRGVAVIPKATEEWMLKENFEALSFKLSHDQMQRIGALDRHYRLFRGEVFRWKKDQKWQELFDYE